MAGRPVKNFSFLFFKIYQVVDSPSSSFFNNGLLFRPGVNAQNIHAELSFSPKMVEFAPPEICSASTKIGRDAGVML